ncbi:hypothetical protein J6590_040128 [Homalodisca vitripennis]|nr:hypothetical protein J6590_040128 [Homalodisca vitripennis]
MPFNADVQNYSEILNKKKMNQSTKRTIRAVKVNDETSNSPYKREVLSLEGREVERGLQETREVEVMHIL